MKEGSLRGKAQGERAVSNLLSLKTTGAWIDFLGQEGLAKIVPLQGSGFMPYAVKTAP